jgi:signal transduction histidine kinase
LSLAVASPAAAQPPADRTQREALFSRPAILAMAAGALVLLLIVGASAWIAVLNHRRLVRVEQAEATQAQIAAVQVGLENAETGQRGFLLTGRESYLAPYSVAVARLPDQIAALRQGLADQPDAPALLDTLEATARAKLAELAATIALFRGGNEAGARAIVLSDHGLAEMETLRRVLNRLAAAERATLRVQTAANNRSNYLLVVIDVLGLAAVAILAAGVGLGVRRTVAVLRAARAELTEANTRLAGMNDALEATVARRTADLQEANEEIQRFAYIVSHDLRAPLVNIMGFTGELEVAAKALRRFTETMPDPVPDDVRTATHEDLPEAIHFIRASTSKMDRLIGAILRLSREGQRSLAPERLDMANLLAGIVDTLRHQTMQGEVEITLEPVPDLVADKLTIEQIFANIIENALKYQMPGRRGRIVVRGSASGSMAHYEIEDNGRGIATKDRQRIFELFRRAGDQTVPGEGIGLAHVRALVRRLGGRIDCQSTPGIGSVFRVDLPLHAAGRGQATAERTKEE